MNLRITGVVASVSILLVTLFATSASAQQSSSATQQNVTFSANSLRIAPVRTEVDIDPGASKQVTVYVQNLTPQAVQARVALSDFEASKDESGKPLVMLDDTYAKSHSLKRLASVEPQIVTLPPNVRVPVVATITVPKNATAGGYYGAVRFLPADSATPEGNGVAITTNIGSLVLLKVNGPTKEKMTLESFEVRQNDKVGTFFKKPDGLKAVIRFNNQGNIQEQPFGKIRLLDRSGKLVEEHEVNNTDPRGNVLPDSIRRFELDLKKVGAFGKYTLEGNFGYGTKGELLTARTSFWVVPTSYMIAAAGALLVIGLIIFLLVKVKRLSGRSRTYGRRY